MAKVPRKPSCKGKPSQVLYKNEGDDTEFLDAEFCCQYHAEERVKEQRSAGVEAWFVEA
jgi:hypothetical protein